jgi:UDP-2,4-diacetamido-2,4,6-trideoxy-beta-L-altropyranose hydrolase
MVAAGIHCRFVCRDLPGHMAEHIRARKIDVVMLPLLAPYTKPKSSEDYAGWLQVQQEQDAAEFIAHLPANCDLVIVDHYALDETWERKVIDHCDRLVVIDDLCRPHIGDFLIDQTFGRDGTAYRQSKVKSILAGEQYALLRPEYYKFHETSIDKQAPARHRLLISVGGYDALNITGAVLDLLARSSVDWLEAVDVVLTVSAPHYKEVRKRVEQASSTWMLHDFVRDFGQLIMRSTLAIGAAGTTTWERAACGLPAIIVPVAENQAATASAMSNAKAAIVIKPEELEGQFDAALIKLRDNWGEFVRANLLITDGLGCRRVLQRLLPLLSEGEKPVWLDLATDADIRPIFEWLATPEAGWKAHGYELVDWASHQRWMQSALHDPECYFYILREADVAVGFVMLNRRGPGEYEVAALLAADVYGHGLSLQALQLLSQLHRGVTIRATVSPADAASSRLFSAAGYKRESSTEFVLRRKS